MKTLLFLAGFLASFPLLAQEQTLIGSSSIDHGGYGALVVKFTSVNDRLGVLVGGRGGWIIDHTFAIGGAGYGLVNRVPAKGIGPFGQHYLNFGYGGLDLEYIANSNSLVHYSLHTLIGAGMVGYRSADWEDVSWTHGDGWDARQDRFFVIEPGANIDVNVTTWFRASAGASYRFIGGVGSDASTGKDLSGPSGMLTLRFGSF